MQVYFVDNEDKLNDFISFYEENKDHFDHVDFDLETDSVSEIKAKVYGIGLCFNKEGEEAFYIPIRRKDGTFVFEHTSTVYDIVSNILEEQTYTGHNVIYDTLVWYYNTGDMLAKHIHADTILMKHCINEEQPFALKETAVAYLGLWADKAQEELYENIKANGGSITKDNLQMFKADTEVLGNYCGWDVMLTRKLYNLFQKKLEQEGLLDFFYKEEVMPLYREVTIPMKLHGFPVDLKYFEKLKVDITKEIDKLEEAAMEAIEPYIKEFQENLLNKECPVKKTGNFPKAFAKSVGWELPSISKKALLELWPATTGQTNFIYWMQDESGIYSPGDLSNIQLRMFFDKFPDQNYVFNLRSKHHLKALLFDILGEEPLSETDKGSPQIDDEFLKSIKNKYSWVSILQDFNKLEKIKGTYIKGILDRQIDGIIYASLLQFGTTSGRYASRNPNLQNLPRPKEDDSGLSELVLSYNNAIRAGFIAPKGYCIVDADYSALEPRCFAHMSGDKNLQLIFHTGTDMYSAIAIKVFGMTGVSAYKKDPNFLGKLHPEKRQIIKAMALAVTYGAEAFRIADLLGVDREEAQRLIDMYMESYPGLKGYIKKCHEEANNLGFVKTIYGRVRHIPEAKAIFNKYGANIINSQWAKKAKASDERRIYKNKLNNSTNFKIQGLAAHIVNRAMLQINREFDKNGIDGWVALQVHDQIASIVKEEQKDAAKSIVRNVMENIVKLDVPLIAEPAIGYNLKESH